MLNQDQSNHPFSKQEFDQMNSGEKILRVAGGILPPEGKADEEALEELLSRIELLPGTSDRLPEMLSAQDNPRQATEVLPVRDNPLQGNDTEDANQIKTPAKENLLQGTDQQTDSKIRALPRLLRSAAAVIFIVLGYYTVSTVLGKENIRTAVAEHSSVTLPDSTGITLNAATKISWDKNSFAGERAVKLSGEAVFDVTKGGRFVIETRNGTVEVLGTRFNVFSREDEFRVSCLRGKVRVSSHQGQQILLAGEEAELTHDGLVKQQKNNIETAISWTEGIFYFEDKPLVSIFDELERQFNVSVRYEEKKDRLMTVGFSNKSLQEALDVICIPMNLDYEIQQDRNVRIFEKK
ncbi:MAG: FecR family protein [Mangrovibacterium sp.]